MSIECCVKLESVIDAECSKHGKLAQTDKSLKPQRRLLTLGATRATVQFVEAAQTVIASRFSVSQLNYIYRAFADPADGVGPLEANVDAFVLSLQTGLEKIAAANVFRPDPTGNLLRQKIDRSQVANKSGS